ncbi:MAG TPA: 2-oxoacid:acceptor oxidoreductase family protein, partial [Spirochaetota bacterium]|nr:2-oxoacid:acceptor oxidoreductase family protein [Spirochaetota bacterium]
MLSKIIIAGFGGQGVIVAGKLLAYAAMKENKEVTHFPSYGAEMRGGTCNCSVIISDNKIANPIIDKPDIGIILNKPSKDKYEKTIQKNGFIIVNKTLSNEPLQRDDLNSKFSNSF